MDSINLSHLQRRARLRYERARWVRGALAFTPALVVVGVAAVLSKRPSSALVLGALMFATGVTLLWRGQAVGRAVLPGFLAGLIPLSLALWANLTHGCTGDHCSSLCLPACAVGGVAAGLAVSTVALRLRQGWRFWLGAAAISMLTAAMGCACVGYTGVLGLGAGFSVGFAPQALRRVFASTS